jgi:type IV pilus assembly protein PilC
MPAFTYTARTTNGELRTSTIDAPSREEVVAQLRRQRMSVVKVDEEAKPKKAKGAIKMRDIVIFTRQFSTMINAGLPLVQALDILAKQTENKALSATTRDVVFDVGTHRGRRTRPAPQCLLGPVREHGRRR